MIAKIITACDITEITRELMPNGKLIVKPAAYYHECDRDELANFLYQHGIYVLPTEELIVWLKNNIIGTAIEIGAGNGAISRTLGIPITDSRMQEDPETIAYYRSIGQQTIKYHDDVEKLNAKEAVKKYNPDTVIGGFITHEWRDDLEHGNYYGVNEEELISNVIRYINIGNLKTHANKPILSREHKEYYFDWLITRAAYQKMNRIFVFEK